MSDGPGGGVIPSAVQTSAEINPGNSGGALVNLDGQVIGDPHARRRQPRVRADGGEVIAAGRAIGTLPTWMADGLAHPGVIALPLLDGPRVRTRLVWHSHGDNPLVDALLELAAAFTSDGRRTGTRT